MKPEPCPNPRCDGGKVLLSPFWSDGPKDDCPDCKECPQCDGTGEKPYGHDGYGLITFTCSDCEGTGRIKK